MGVRFACHACGKRLNIKSELAGRRGICPACSVRFRIPIHDTETSTPVEHSDSNGSSDSVITSNGESIAVSQAANSPVTSSMGGTATRSAPTSQSQPQPNSAQRSSRQAAPHPQPHTPAPQSLEQILGGSSATWYVRPPSGGQYGPADGPTLGQWISEGRVADTAMLWRDGWLDWRSAKQVLPIFNNNGSTANSASPTQSIPPRPIADVNGSGMIAEQATATTEPSSELRTGGKVLGTNKKKVSRKRVAISAVLACVFLVLLVALIFVLKQP
jgi:hypothetical protein